jgi:hypothetical protein
MPANAPKPESVEFDNAVDANYVIEFEKARKRSGMRHHANMA